jgi:hypothetical protein
MKRLALFSVLAAFGLAAHAQNALTLPKPSVGGADTAFIRNAPSYVDARALAANTSETATIPTGAKWVLFSGACNFFAKPGASASVPGDTTDGSAAEQNPSAWWIPSGVTQITVIAASTCIVTLTFYS